MPATPPIATPPLLSFREAFPNATKVLVEGPRGVRVPLREIGLSGGEPPVRVYDTSGPQGVDVMQGLPPLRHPWIIERDVERIGMRAGRIGPHGSDGVIPVTLRRPVFRGRGPVTQLHYARRGEITPEMEFVALREGMAAEFVRAEVARGRAIISQHQSSGTRADDHRPRLPGEDQCQYR